MITPTALDRGGNGPSQSSGVSGVESHPSQSPPRDRIAAGDQVLAAYYSTRKVRQPDHDVIQTRTYHLLNPRTGRYTTDPRWSDVAVAPGLRTAVVIEQTLPARRVGLLDLATDQVTRWIPVPQGAGAVAVSPDGGKAVVTTYDQNPNRLFWANRSMVNDTYEPQPEYSRTGFAVVDLPSGASQWHPVAPDVSVPFEAFPRSGSALLFSSDGSLLMDRRMTAPVTVFRRLDGTAVPAPEREKYEDTEGAPAGLSPDGTLMAGGSASHGWSTATEVLDPVTGKRVALLRGEVLLAWVDDKHLIAWDIMPGSKNEFGNRLVLVTVGGSKEVPLSGPRHTASDEPSPARWEPVFAHR